jgi:hypothetical protein
MFCGGDGVVYQCSNLVKEFLTIWRFGRKNWKDLNFTKK